MNQQMIVRAWEDSTYRAGLAPEIRASLPASPCGISMNDLGKAEVREMVGVTQSPLMMGTQFMTNCCHI